MYQKEQKFQPQSEACTKLVLLDDLIKPRSLLSLSDNYLSHEIHIFYSEIRLPQVISKWRNEKCLVGTQIIFFLFLFFF